MDTNTVFSNEYVYALADRMVVYIDGVYAGCASDRWLLKKAIEEEVGKEEEK